MSKKILSVLMTVVLVVATLCMTAVSASALTGTVYFEVPADWGEYETIYCHYWGDGITSPDWQTEPEVCTEAADGIYGYVLPEGTTGFIFSANNGIQTADLSLTEDCIGKVGKAAARVEGENVAVASWDAPTVELAEVTPVVVDTEDGDTAASGQISGKIYFEVPDTWKNFETIYCHYWDADGNGPSWQSDAEVCEKVSDKIYCMDLPEGAWEFAIFSNDNAMQTGNTPITANEIGKVMYLTGNKVENPVNGEEVDEALWKDYEVAKISGKIYFEVPDTWKNFETIYCHYWDADGNGPSWQSDAEVCEKVSDKIYCMDLPEGAWEFAIFSNDNAMQTGNTPITANEIGKVMYLTGNKVENPVNGEEVDEALWKDYVAEETPTESKDETTESKTDASAEQSNNLWLYIVIAAVVVVLVIVIIVVAKKKKK
ncbi:MAG: starch-binding protein [Acutalibacteraceae bacterium]